MRMWAFTQRIHLLRNFQLNIEAQNVVIVRFFGYFFMIVHLGQVIGNIISSLILTNVIISAPHEEQVLAYQVQ